MRRHASRTCSTARVRALSLAGRRHALRVATYNIHKGVRGVGPRKRLEIHNLGLGVEALDADLVFLQEVRLFHRRESRRFDRTWFGWPEQGQADYLAPEGYDVAYRTNAITRHGEHGNALLSRWPIGDVDHHDVSDHRFEQRGLLHVPVLLATAAPLHAVVAHFGLMHAGRVRQVERLSRFIADFVPRGAPLLVAGDFNDWGERLDEPMRGDRPGARAVASSAVRRAAHLPVAGAGVCARSGLHPRAFAASRRRCRAARPGRACPTTCRWWSSWSPVVQGRHASRALNSTKRRPRRWLPVHGHGGARRSSWAATACACCDGGDELFPAMREAIASARHEVWLATYIFHDDDASRDVARRSPMPAVVACTSVSSSTASAPRPRCPPA